jgi:hypothetical protein
MLAVALVGSRGIASFFGGRDQPGARPAKRKKPAPSPSVEAKDASAMEEGRASSSQASPAVEGEPKPDAKKLWTSEECQTWIDKWSKPPPPGGKLRAHYTWVYWDHEKSAARCRPCVDGKKMSICDDGRKNTGYHGLCKTKDGLQGPMRTGTHYLLFRNSGLLSAQIMALHTNLRSSLTYTLFMRRYM